MAQGATDAASTHMHVFGHNTHEDYYGHGMDEFPWPDRLMLAIVIVIVTLATKIAWRWKIEDGDLLWKDRRGRVLIGNHQSMLDPVVVICSMWLRGIHVRPIYKSEFDDHGIVTWFFARVGGIPVTRNSADIQFVRYAQQALRRGECVLIYPEGTRIRSDSQPVTIHKGFALVARLAKAPVQPISIVGARAITPEGTHLKRFGRVFLKAGEPLEFSSVKDLPRKQQADAIEKSAMDRVYELMGELRAEHPGKM